MGEEKKDILEEAIQNEYDNGRNMELGSEEMTKSNKVISELYKAKAELEKTKVEKELESEKLEAETQIKLAEIEAEERKDKRQNVQRYVNTGCMVGLGLLAMFADSDSFIGRVNSRVLGFATKVLFKG